jgi:hypothetical protein
MRTADPSLLRRCGALPLRVPFTIVSVIGLSARAIRTNTATADASNRVLQHVGFAPQDLVLFGWRRLISSAMFTHGRLEFWVAITMIVLACGAAELIVGTRRAAATFWGVHLVTLLAESLLIALPLSLAGVRAGKDLSDVRDVGPSAGYVAALGLVCAMLPGRWPRISAIAVLTILLVLTFTPAGGDDQTARLSAGIAHLIAFPLGYATASLWRKTWVPRTPLIERGSREIGPGRAAS